VCEAETFIYLDIVKAIYTWVPSSSGDHQVSGSNKARTEPTAMRQGCLLEKPSFLAIDSGRAASIERGFSL